MVDYFFWVTYPTLVVRFFFHLIYNTPHCFIITDTKIWFHFICSMKFPWKIKRDSVVIFNWTSNWHRSWFKINLIIHHALGCKQLWSWQDNLTKKKKICNVQHYRFRLVFFLFFVPVLTLCSRDAKSDSSQFFFPATNQHLFYLVYSGLSAFFLLAKLKFHTWH